MLMGEKVRFSRAIRATMGKMVTYFAFVCMVCMISVASHNEYSIDVYDGEEVTYGEAYELKEKDCLGHSNTEYKTRGWISYKDHKLGVIGRECPVCGYKYGTAWKMEEVPQDIIEWLESLPETKVKPAWV